MSVKTKGSKERPLAFLILLSLMLHFDSCYDLIVALLYIHLLLLLGDSVIPIGQCLQ
jgi:hypothetical protein